MSKLHLYHFLFGLSFFLFVLGVYTIFFNPNAWWAIKQQNGYPLIADGIGMFGLVAITQILAIIDAFIESVNYE